MFQLTWQHVNPCYNVTLTSKNGSLEIAPTGETSCTYSLLLPYGYRASLTLRLPRQDEQDRPALTAVLPGTYTLSKGIPEVYVSFIIYMCIKKWSTLYILQAFPYVDFRSSTNMRMQLSNFFEHADDVNFEDCDGVALQLIDGPGAWFYCARSGISSYSETQLLSSRNSMTVRVEAKAGLLAYPAMYIKYVHNIPRWTISPDYSPYLYRYSMFPHWLSHAIITCRYEATGEDSLVAGCPWPWLRHLNLCLRVVEEARNWDMAEADCQVNGGHLASIRSQDLQDLVDLMLINRWAQLKKSWKEFI